MQDIFAQLGNSSASLVIRVGELLGTALIYFAIAWLIIRLGIRRIEQLGVVQKYGKNGSTIGFRLISAAVYLIAAIGVLSQFGIDTRGILTLASAGTVAMGLALQDVMRNLISGLFMIAEKPFQVGDRVQIRDQAGTVQNIDIRTTHLRTDDGSLLMVPNQLMFTEILQNTSHFNLSVIRYRITTGLPAAELHKQLISVAESLNGVFAPVHSPMLIEHEGEESQWEVEFPMNATLDHGDRELGERLVQTMPTAKIERVE